MRAPPVLVAVGTVAIAILVAVWFELRVSDSPVPLATTSTARSTDTAAPHDEPLERPEPAIAREPAAERPEVVVEVAEPARVPAATATSPAAASSERKFTIHVRDAQDASRVLDGVAVTVVDLYDLTQPVTRAAPDTFTTGVLGPGQYVVSARARDHLPAHEIAGTGEGTKDVVVTLVRCDTIQVHWRATDGTPLLAAFDRAAPEAFSPLVSLAVLATREPAEEFVPAFETNVGVLSVRHYAPPRPAPGRVPNGAQPPNPPPNDVIGVLQAQIAPPFYASAWMNGVFVDSRRIEAGTGEITFSCELPEVSRRSATLKLHVVDADTDKSVATAKILVDQPEFGRVGVPVDADGRILLGNLRSGAADVWVEAPDRAKVCAHVLLRSSGITDLGDVRLEAPIQVSARVVDEQGTLLPSVPLEFIPVDDRLEPLAGAPAREIATPASGIAKLDVDVRRVRYIVRFADSIDRFAAVPIVLDARSGSAEGQLVLTAGRKVSIAIQPPPEAGSFVRVTTSDGVLARRKKVGEAGRVVVSLAPGRYELALVESGVARPVKSFDVGADWLLLAVDR